MQDSIEMERIYTELASIHQEVATLKMTLAQLVASSQAKQTTNYPYVVCDPAIHGGEPTLRGSSITVRTIVERTRLGEAPEQVMEAYPVLTLAQIHAALGYYYDHPGEIERYIRENREALWQTQTRASS